LPEAYSSTDILANRFCITLRGLTDQDLPTLARTLEEVKHCGVPNYFDDQRFGSVDTSSDPPAFVARAMIRGEFEQGLKLALTAPYEYDRAADKALKQLLRQHWGDWPELKARLPRSHARSLVDYLVSHPTDFRGALLRVRPELRGLYLSAYQSYLWNRILARWLTTHLPPEQLGELVLRIGRLPTPRAVPPELLQRLHTLELPLPSARMRLSGRRPARRPDPTSGCGGRVCCRVDADSRHG
jgi:tRNA pseudouridine13 synthase